MKKINKTIDEIATFLFEEGIRTLSELKTETNWEYLIYPYYKTYDYTGSILLNTKEGFVVVPYDPEYDRIILQEDAIHKFTKEDLEMFLLFKEDMDKKQKKINYVFENQKMRTLFLQKESD